jgi:hypothetical protein
MRLRQGDVALMIASVDFSVVKKVLAEAHYIGKPGSTSVRLGLWIDHQLAGVITYGTIPRPNARAICGPEYQATVLELTRLALYDWAPPNSESWLIAHSYSHVLAARPETRILISYADGRMNHAGTIYQASNWLFTGSSTGDVIYKCDDGRILHPRTVGWTDLPPGGWMPAGDKYRYVHFIGDRSQRRVARRALRWPVLPYPKLNDSGLREVARLAEGK